MGVTVLSPAELATMRPDEDLVALMAENCPHCRAEHARPSPDMAQQLGKHVAHNGAPITTSHIRENRAARALLPGA